MEPYLKAGRLVAFAALWLCPLAAWPQDPGCCVDGHSIITTYAGNGSSGYSGDGGPALKATFRGIQHPDDAEEFSLNGLFSDPQGNLYVCDSGNHVVRVITPDGIIQTWAGNGKQGFAGDGGPADEAEFKKPTQVTEDLQGNFYVCDAGDDRIRKIAPDGTITTFAGDGRGLYRGDGGPATLASLCYPYGVAADPRGNIYISEPGNHVIRKVSPSGIISTICGDGTRGDDGDGGPAVKAHVNGPEYVVVDPKGNIFFNDDHYIPHVVKGATQIHKIDRRGKLTTVAGNGWSGSTGDGGPAIEAQLDDTHGIAFCGGNIYVSELWGHKLWRIDPKGIIHTLAGDGRDLKLGDGGPAMSASITVPVGVAIDCSGNLYFVDDAKHVVRKIAPRCPPDPSTISFLCVSPPPPSPYLAGLGRRHSHAAIPTPSRTPAFTPTPTPGKKGIARATPTPLPGWKTTVTAIPAIRRGWKERAFLTVTPTSTPTLSRRKYPTPTPDPSGSLRPENSTGGAAETIVYSNPPANIYLTLEDGPGNYKLEVLDGKGGHLKTPFEQKVVEEKGVWVYWDGTDEEGAVMPLGTYFAQLTKDGELLRRIVIIRVPASP